MMIDVSTVSIVIASAGVLAGVVYYFLDIRHQSRVRQWENVIRLSPYFNMNAREVQEAVIQVCSIEYENYKDYLEKYSGKPEDMALKILGNYFEGIGILVHRKLVKVDIVNDFWGDIIHSAWDEVKPLIISMREDSDDQNIFRSWEYLNDEIRKGEHKLQTKD